MGQFTNSISQVAKNYKKYDDWEQKQADLEAKKIYLNKKAPLDDFKKQELKRKAESVVRVTEIMDARSEDNAQDVEMLTQTAVSFISIPIVFALSLLSTKLTLQAKTTKAMIKNNIIGQSIMIFGAMALGIAGILWGNAKTKEASRLGRYQAKMHNLKDVKNFVQFTPEQIAQAEKISKTIPDEKKRGSIMQAINNVKEMMRDRKAYIAYRKKLASKPTTKPSFTLTKEQLAQANADKTLMHTIIKKINNKAEDYTENTENAFDTLLMTSFLATVPLGYGLNKLFKLLKLNIPKAKVAGGIAVLFPLIVSLVSLAAEKKASRVGRYKARQEILQNPEILRHYTDEELKEAENIKAPTNKKSFFKKLGDNFKFLFTYFKDKKEYDKYKETKYKEKEKINKALLQVKVTDKQLKEAKHLQEKSFMSFDKMDEMSQRYSEDMEAATEIGKQLISTSFSIIGVGITVAGTLALIFGKIPWHRVGKILSNLTFKKGSGIRNFIDNLYSIINKDKALKKAFNKTLSPTATKEAKELLMNNPELKKAISDGTLKAIASAKNISILKVLSFIQDSGIKIKQPEGMQLLEKIMKTSATKDVGKIKTILSEGISKGLIEFSGDRTKFIELLRNSSFVKNTFNDNFFARWARKILLEFGIGYGRVKGVLNKESLDIANKLMGKKSNSFYQTYKTIINTSAICAIPVLGAIIAVPYALCSWLTNVQKKAGKIGVMEAINDLNNPNLYVNKDAETANKTEIRSQKEEVVKQAQASDKMQSFLDAAKQKKSA